MARPVRYHTGKFPPKRLDWDRLIPLIGPASGALARYDGLLSAIPNADVLLSPLTTQEAVLSSRIEGTQATMGEVLEFEAGGASDTLDPKKIDDIHEILNYRRAMRDAVDRLGKLPLCQRVIKEIHATLLEEVRGHDRARGRYKPVPNYIGPMGCTLEQARFIPIAPEDVEEGMSQWEKYLHATAPDRLVQLAIAHAEFEALHPFLDGNGRLGRMLIPLFLYDRKLLHAPMFYLSEYLEANRQEYYDRLLAVSSQNDWTGWCGFFLQALEQQAKENEAKTRRVLALYEEKKGWMVQATHSQYAIVALDFLFSQPVFSSSHFVTAANIPAATARRILKLASEGGLLQILRPARGRRSAIFVFPELLNAAEGRDVF
ncbi:MAG: Fic family protein [Planctomycetes bacterium]|nr:Fic family protein [Planctomycetota bacterium]